MKLTVSKVKTFRGHEGSGYNAVLHADGRPVADVIDEGNGGAPFFVWRARGDYKSVLDWIAAQPVADLGLDDADIYTSPSMRLEAVLARLVDQYEEAKRLRRLQKSAVVFRDSGQTFTLKLGTHPRADVEAEVLRRFPRAEIVREVAP